MSKPETYASLEGNTLPTSLQQVGIIARNEMLNYFRSRRFVALLVITLMIAAALTIVVWHAGVANIAATTGTASVANNDLDFYSLWWGFTASLLVVFCAVFFGGDAISGEFQNKTGYFLVGNPVRRSSIYVGKWIAAFAASLIIFGVFTAITLANGIGYFGFNIPGLFVESFGFTILYLVAALGFTFFFSSLFKTSSMSIMVTVILLLFGFTLIDTLLTDLAHVEPWFSLAYGSTIIANVMTTPYPSHITSTAIRAAAGSPLLTSYSATIVEGIRYHVHLLCRHSGRWLGPFREKRVQLGFLFNPQR
jgi:ABC-2 type transport system permease protein